MTALKETSAPRRRRLRHLAAVVTLVVVAAWVFRSMDSRRVWVALAAARPEWLALAAALNLLAVALQAGRWLALVRPFCPSLDLGSAFKAMVVGNAVSTLLPARAGELARVEWIARRTGVARAPVLGSIVLDYLVNAVGLVLGVALLPLVVPVPKWIRGGVVLTVSLFSIGAIVVARARPGRTSSAAAGAGLRGRVLTALANAREGLAAMNDPRALMASFCASLASWILELDVVASTMKAMGVQAPIEAALLVLLGVNLALAFPFAPPANVGTLELGATFALMGFGVAKEQALAFGLIYHAIQIVPIGMLGMVFAGRAASDSNSSRKAASERFR